MSDFTLVDTRGRAAGAALREAALRRPLASSSSPVNSSGALGRPSPTSRLRPALIAAFVVLLIAALVALATRDPQPAQPTGPKDLRYIVTGLDQFWSVEGARDGGGVAANDTPGMYGTLFGTLGDPTRPALLLTWVDANAANAQPFNNQRFGVLIGAENVEQFEVDGMPAGCGERATGETQCRVETANGFVAATAVGVSRSDLRAILSSVQHDGRFVTVEPASLPSALTEVATGQFSTVIGFDDTFRDDASAVRYTNSDGSSVTVTVVHDDGTRLTRLAIKPGWQQTLLGDRPGFRLSPTPDKSSVTWMRNGEVFTVQASAGSNVAGTAEALATKFATSLRRATDEEWSALPRWRDDVVDPGTEITATTPVPTSASISTPTSGGDVEVGLDLTSQFGGEFAVRSTGPGVADDQVTVGLAIDSFMITGPSGSVTLRVVPTEPLLDLVGLDSVRGVYLLTPVDGELVVTGQDGTRYHATPQAIFDGNEIRFAMIILPMSYTSAQFVAPDGTVIAEIPGNL